MQATTPPADVPGYRLEQFLGSGAFGQVWVGRDLNTGRPVAIKFFLHRGGVNWSLLSHEVKNLVQLSADRHIVQVLEVGWDSDPPYYVMELVTGGSLEEMLSERGALPVTEAVQLFRQICIGLRNSHSKGVLHCDLKPANILLGEGDEPRLADFGQSRMTHDQTPALGTLFYMAPEQADLNSSPSSAWDVYAVGAILYRMLTGGPPYRDDTITRQLDTAGSLPKRLQRYRESIRNAPPPTRHIQEKGVDRALSNLVSRCLAPNPADRFGTIQEIIQQLDEREERHALRPLMMLGILGPVLLLIAISIFAVRTVNRARESMEDAVRVEAFNMNTLAAKFAARTLESELDRYFELCREEIDRPEFQQKLLMTLRDGSVASDLKIIADQGTSELAGKMVDTREALLDREARIELDQYLARRLRRFTNAPVESRAPKLASMFVTDSDGTIFGMAYAKTVSRDQNSTGRNYSYRTYFHAGKDDLPRDTPIDSITPLSQMHLSAAFESTGTGLWKVAISAPIYASANDQSRPDGVFVITINLGDFELLQSETGGNQVAVLLEAREGTRQGTLLQHPYMDSRAAEGKKAHEGENFQISEAQFRELLQGGDVTYLDPVAKAPDGTGFGGQWIAAVQPVAVPKEQVVDENEDASFATRDKADLMVLVQYRLSKVLAPVDVMEESLFWEGVAGFLSILVVSGSLWFFVRRASTEHWAGRRRLGSDSNSTRLDSEPSGESQNGLGGGPGSGSPGGSAGGQPKYGRRKTDVGSPVDAESVEDAAGSIPSSLVRPGKTPHAGSGMTETLHSPLPQEESAPAEETPKKSSSD